MLNVSFELENFQPLDLEEIEKEAGDLPEDTVKAIQLFNKALEDIKSGNEDIAIIQLKKAISLYPSFFEAMNLLGICYYAAGKEDAARSAFKQVIDADDSGLKAMQYLNKMDGLVEQTDSGSVNNKRKSSKSSKGSRSSKEGGLFSEWVAKGLKAEDNSIYGLKYIAGILIGVLIMGLIWYMVPTNKSLFTITKEENIIKDPELENQINQLNSRIEKLEQDLDNKKEENLKLMESFGVYKDWVARLKQAEEIYNEGKYIEAAELMMNQQGTAVPDDLKGTYDSLWDQIRLKAANQYYNDGNKTYNGNTARDIGVYRTALEQYETAIALIDADSVTYKAALYYQAGKAAARCNELEKAVELFEYVADEFPNSSYSSYSISRLKEIESGSEISGN
ncbi:MAG: tetratricopeptide repeat protein [Clostridiaceae bacterium]|jgi:tetratricopeptide (TPR) repeat protein|nr:tetratricopeptide repeat protein [Clostridiaceae bacterium]